MTIIIDYGVGNLGSIQNMLKKIGVESKITSNEAEISTASKLILPGVGSFDYGMQQLHERNLVNILNNAVVEKKMPILGICLGAQLLTKRSEEGKMNGLGWIDAETIKFDTQNGLKVPNMGWQNVTLTKESKLTKNLPYEPRFYFVHSYYIKPKNETDTIISANYGVEYTCGVEKENIIGVQFHPEKSHKFGMSLLKNFVENY